MQEIESHYTAKPNLVFYLPHQTIFPPFKNPSCTARHGQDKISFLSLSTPFIGSHPLQNQMERYKIRIVKQGTIMLQWKTVMLCSDKAMPATGWGHRKLLDRLLGTCVRASVSETKKTNKISFLPIALSCCECIHCSEASSAVWHQGLFCVAIFFCFTLSLLLL